MALALKDFEALIKQACPAGMSESAFREILTLLIAEINTKT
jgi:hypothetical protein